MGHLRFATTGLVATALLSCGGEDLVLPSEGEPAAISIVDGNGQSGRVGEALAKPLIVQVFDGVDRPVVGATVVVEFSGGSAEPDTLSTVAEGKASAQITLGPAVGEAAGAVRVIAPESPVAVEASFTVTAVAASANGLAAVSGDSQTAVAGTALTEPLVVRVTDAFGNPIEGMTVAWTADVGGSVSAPSTTSDAQGLTSVSRTLGPTAGAQTTQASSIGLAGSPVIFNHTATAGNPSGVLILAGNEQSAAPGTVLPVALVVAVVDADSNPVVGAAVTWVVTAGGGSLEPTTGTTDANGRASTQWTLGPAAGTNTAQAIVSGVGQAEFTATAAAGSASQIVIVSGNGQTGQAGAPLGAGLVVRVTDDGGNPVSSVPVTWAVQAGGGSVSPPSVTTGADGLASTAWRLGASLGTQRVQASAPGAGSVQFTATSTVGAPAILGLVTQPSAQAQVGIAFARQPVVQVRDAAGNPVQAGGVTVTAAIASGGGTLQGTRTQTTGPGGRATFTDLRIDGAVGAHALIFAAPGLTSVTSAGIAVNPVGTSTRITSDAPDPSAPGQAVEVVFEVTSSGGTPSGTVDVTASGGSEGCSAAVSAGRCTITLTAEGDRTLTATFQGSALFQPSSGNTSHSVVTPDTPPNAVDDGYSATSGTQLSEPAPGVLGNDVDVDGDAKTAELVSGSGPARGTLTLRADGSFDYLPNADFFGEDSFDYRVTAGSGSDVGRVTIIVN